MHNATVIIGLGEMGGVFARGLLRSSHSVIPVTRSDAINDIASSITQPQSVLICVGENDLQTVLSGIPDSWKDRLILVQNELLPRDWQQHSIDKPTVISVWFEKKKGQDYKVIIPSPVYGPLADTVKNSLRSLDIPCTIVPSMHQMLYELVRKNVYILTSNIAGLVVGGNVGELWQKHRELALATANEIIDIQEWLSNTTMDRGKLIDGMVEAFQGDLLHGCTGRSAPHRLKRAILFADEAGLKTPRLRQILRDHTEAQNS